MNYSLLRSEYSADELNTIFSDQDREVCDLVARVIRACQREVATGNLLSETFRYEIGRTLAEQLPVKGHTVRQFETYIADLLAQPLQD